MLRLCGAELILVPAVPYKDPNNYVRYSGRLAEELAAKRAEGRDLGEPVRQHRQPAGAHRGHRPRDLAPDRGQGRRVRQLRSAPAARSPASAWRSRSSNPKVVIALADPLGSAIYNYYAHGELKAEGNSITEGIGQGRITEEPRGRAGRRLVPDPGRRGAAAGVRPRAGGGAGARRLDRDQHRRRDPAGPRDGAGAHDRDRALRLRQPLPEQDVQPRLPAREGPAGAVLAGRRTELNSEEWDRHGRERQRPGQHRVAGRASRDPRRQGGRCHLVSADHAAGREGRVCRGAHPGCGLFRHRRHRRCRRAPCPTCCRTRSSSRAGCGSSASATARGSSSTTTTATRRAPVPGGCSGCSGTRTWPCSMAASRNGGPRGGRSTTGRSCRARRISRRARTVCWCAIWSRSAPIWSRGASRCSTSARPAGSPAPSPSRGPACVPATSRRA